MKTAGDILSALFDEQFMKKAQGVSKLFDSWADITEKNGIAAAASHSRIKDLDRGILLVEMDHPGWKQLIQTKQSKLLNDFRRRFPELEISGISLMLGSGGPHGDPLAEKETKTETTEEPTAQTAAVEEQPAAKGEPALSGYDAIKDEDFREKLMALGKALAAEEKRG